MSAVWDMQEIDRSHKFVLLCYADYANDEGICWPSISSIARRTGYSDRQIKRIKASLQKDGHISVLRGGGNIDGKNTSDLLQIHWQPLYIKPGCQNVTPIDSGCQKEQDGVTKSADRGDTHVTLSTKNHQEPSGGLAKIKKFGPGPGHVQAGYYEAMADAKEAGLDPPEGLSVLAIRAMIADVQRQADQSVS